MHRPSLALDAASAVDVLRYSLQRRHFADGATLTVAETRGPDARHATFFEVESFMEAEPDQLRELVTSLLGALHSANIELLAWIRGDGHRLRFFYGVVAAGRDEVDPRRAEVLRHALEGFYPGVRLLPVSGLAELENLRNSLADHRAVGAIVGIPSERSETAVETRLDEALEGLASRRFDLLIQCTPVAETDLDIATANIAYLSGAAHALARCSISRSRTSSFSQALTTGIGTTIGGSETRSWTTSQSVSAVKVENTDEVALAQGVGMLLGAALGGIVGSYASPVGAKVGMDVGVKLGGSVAAALVPPKQTTTGTTTTEGTTETLSRNESMSQSEAETWGASLANQLSFETIDRQAIALEDLAEHHLERLRRGRALGAWRVAVHVAAADETTRDVASHLLMGALRGDETHVERLALVNYRKDSVPRALAAVAAFSPPRLSATAHPFIPHAEQPWTQLSGHELAHWLRPPARDVAGIWVRRPVRFARGPLPRDRHERAITLGAVTHWGRVAAATPFSIPLDDLTRHVFIAGTTGSGKTTTLRRILWELASHDVPFLVIEPAKSGFADLRAGLRRAGKNPLRLVLGSPRSADELTFTFNPFRAPVGTSLGRHAEAVKILLRSCFEMQESLPQLLERVVFDTYADLGWADLVSPITESDVSSRRFPCFPDLLGTKFVPALNRKATRVDSVVHDFGYEPRIAASLAAALRVRLESFCRGVKGVVFREQEVDLADVLSRPCFLDLSEVSEPDVRRFLIGALLLRIYAEREADTRRRGPARGLRHVLVIDEAHHVLRAATGSGPSAELIRQSNLVLTDAFAELREFGQAIIAADQAPGDLVPAVLRNTGTKIIHTLFYEADVAAVGDAIGLDTSQRSELRRLPRGECVVSSTELPAPVTCRVTPVVEDGEDAP